MEARPRNTPIRLAVLPLRALCEDDRLPIFCQGLVIDLITDLSRFRTIQIIANETSGAFDPDADARTPGIGDLGLDYLVKGVARHHDGTLLLNIQLINAREQRLVWAEQFTGHLDELFRLQGEIMERIVMSVQHFVDHDILARVRKRQLPGLNTYECWLRGYQELKAGSVEADERARACFRRAIDLDPHYARAYTGMSLSYFNEWSCQLWSRWEVSQNGAFEWASKAVDIDEGDHVSNAILGRLLVFREEYDKAEHFLRRSLRANPNDAETLVHIAVGLTYLGFAAEALEYYQRARRLNPAHSFAAPGMFINLELGRYEEALALSREPNAGLYWLDFPAFRAALAYLMGDHDSMWAFWSEFLHVFSNKINNGVPADNGSAIRWMIDVNPYRGDSRVGPFWEFMRTQSPKPALPPENPSRPTGNLFRRKGEMWECVFAGIDVMLPDFKGLHDIATLLARPDEPVHCTELMGAAVVERGEELFDRKAKLEYRDRVQSLRARIEEAEGSGDENRAEALRGEYEDLVAHLMKMTGKGGRSRKAGSGVEKARTAVTWRIRKAMKKIAEVHEPLRKHLETSIRTGVFCQYSPEHTTHWNV